MDLYEQIVRAYSDAEKQNTALRNVTSPLPLTPEETVWYRAFLAEAEEMERKYGERPVFDLCELD